MYRLQDIDTIMSYEIMKLKVSTPKQEVSIGDVVHRLSRFLKENY